MLPLLGTKTRFVFPIVVGVVGVLPAWLVYRFATVLKALVLGGKVAALLDGRANVDFADVQRIAPAALRHRVQISYAGQAEGVTPDAVVHDILASVSPEGM